MKQRDVHAIIVAAGQGTRLRPVTDDKPKCMIPFLGQTLLERQKNTLFKLGIQNITVVAGYKHEVIPRHPFHVILNENYAETNMVYTLFCAESSIKPSHDILIIYGDCVYETRVVQALLDADLDQAIAIDLHWKNYWDVRLDNPLNDAETLRLDDDGYVLELEKNLSLMIKFKVSIWG